jgi:hypothetical protein
MKLIKLIDSASASRLADGCILPDGQVAIAWCGEHKTHGTYPSLESFEAIQSKILNRLIEEYELSYQEICLGLHTYTFQLVRDDDATGVSGTVLLLLAVIFCMLAAYFSGQVKSNQPFGIRILKPSKPCMVTMAKLVLS